MKELDDFLAAAAAAPRRCATCANEKVRNVVSLHLDRLEAGATAVTLCRVHSGLLVGMGAPSWNSVKKHVRDCLRRDHETGLPL